MSDMSLRSFVLQSDFTSSTCSGAATPCNPTTTRPCFLECQVLPSQEINWIHPRVIDKGDGQNLASSSHASSLEQPPHRLCSIEKHCKKHFTTGRNLAPPRCSWMSMLNRGCFRSILWAYRGRCKISSIHCIVATLWCHYQADRFSLNVLVAQPCGPQFENVATKMNLSDFRASPRKTMAEVPASEVPQAQHVAMVFGLP